MAARGRGVERGQDKGVSHDRTVLDSNYGHNPNLKLCELNFCTHETRSPHSPSQHLVPGIRHSAFCFCEFGCPRSLIDMNHTDLSCCDLLISLSTMSSASPHVVAWVRVPSSLSSTAFPGVDAQSVYPFILHGRLGCLRLWASVGSAATNTACKHLFKALLLILLGMCPEVDLQDHMVILRLISGGTAAPFSTVAAPFRIPQQ